MNKKRVFCLIEALLFLAVLFGVVGVCSRVLERKASRVKFAPFLENPKQYDVLFIGDSHMYNSVLPMELWDDYGIASYNIACFGNTIPVSYWSMMLALDECSPKLMVIGIKDSDKHYKLTGSSADVHTAMDAFPNSLTKVRAIYDLTDDPYATDDAGNRYQDIRWEYFFTLGKYHSRWSELTPEDFFCEGNVQKGAGMAVNVAVPDDYEITDRYAEESGWGYTYLRKMIEECQSRGIDVLLTHLPFPADQGDQMCGNTVLSIAQECGVAYIDFVNMDQVADYTVDCYDADSHLNPSGARKTTDYLGRYIVDHYAIEDHRNDPAYSHWYDEYNMYVQQKHEFLCIQRKLENVLMLLHDEDFSAVIAVREGAALYDDDRLMTLMHNIAREHIYEEDAFSKWSGSLFPLNGIEEAYWDAQSYLLVMDREMDAIDEYVGAGSIVHDASFGSLKMRDDHSPWRLETKAGTEVFFDQQDEDWQVRMLVINKRDGQIQELQFR